MVKLFVMIDNLLLSDNLIYDWIWFKLFKWNDYGLYCNPTILIVSSSLTFLWPLLKLNYLDLYHHEPNPYLDKLLSSLAEQLLSSLPGQIIVILTWNCCIHP